MNRWQLREQFGTRPDVHAVLIWSVQHALKGWGTRHPDMKRQRKARLRDLTIYRSRQLKGVR